jgi:hypothetical protein
VGTLAFVAPLAVVAAVAIGGAAAGSVRPRANPRGGTGAAGSVTIDLSHPVNRFRPDRALGAGVDGHDQGDTRLIYTPANLRAMRSAGLRPLTYRLRTELAVEAWHWNPQGSWSDPRRRQGYWTGSSTPGAPFATTYGYRLPRRGDTIDQANDDGYSRLDDGSTKTFWKSNPYLDPHFTHAAERLHPQWMLVDLGRPTPVDALRIAWGSPYAHAVRVEYFVGRDALMFANDPTGYWLPFANATFRGAPGTQTLRLEQAPRLARYVRVLMYSSSHTGPRGSADVRDRLGFAVRELWVGTQLRGGKLRDAIRHAPSRSRQTVTYVSSTDPWHRAGDRDPHTEQPSFLTVKRSGLTNGQPMLTPVAVLYGTPPDAAAELRYLRAIHLPVRRVELGEEPDGQLVTPEDYGALYAQFARALHGADRQLQLGGPGFQTSIPDWVSWPMRPGGDTSWTRRFLQELHRRHASRDLSFFSFEWYPFDNGCLPPAPQLARAPAMLDHVIEAQRAAGLPRAMPMLITEYGYSAFATRDMVEMPGALLNADTVARFLADGGDATYLYGYEPDALISELPRCDSWGNLILFLSNDQHVIRQPVPAYWGARMLTGDWAQPGGGQHAMYAADATPRDADGRPLVTAYAVRRPDGRLAVLLLNKDPARSWTLDVRAGAPGAEQALAGSVDVVAYSRAQYAWHARGDHGFARPDLPPARGRRPAGAPVTLPPWSLTVVRTAGPVPAAGGQRWRTGATMRTR